MAAILSRGRWANAAEIGEELVTLETVSVAAMVYNPSCVCISGNTIASMIDDWYAIMSDQGSQLISYCTLLV